MCFVCFPEELLFYITDGYNQVLTKGKSTRGTGVSHLAEGPKTRATDTDPEGGGGEKKKAESNNQSVAGSAELRIRIERSYMSMYIQTYSTSVPEGCSQANGSTVVLIILGPLSCSILSIPLERARSIWACGNVLYWRL